MNCCACGGKAHPPPLDHGARLGILQDGSILIEPAGRHFADDAGLARHYATLCDPRLNPAQAMELARLAKAAGVKAGVIQDKLFLPGFAKLMWLKRSGFFGRIVSARIDAGSWIFDGETQVCQRPSWNYTQAGGGGLMLDMYPHWRYIIEGLLGPIRRIVTAATTATGRRRNAGDGHDAWDTGANRSPPPALHSGECASN